MNHVILSPVITEKSIMDAQNGRFTFAVALQATKDTIRQAVAKQFNVTVVKVSTITTKGKSKRIGKRRTEKFLAPFKKAIVEVEKGQKIALFDLGENK